MAFARDALQPATPKNSQEFTTPDQVASHCRGLFCSMKANGCQLMFESFSVEKFSTAKMRRTAALAFRGRIGILMLCRQATVTFDPAHRRGHVSSFAAPVAFLVAFDKCLLAQA